MSGADRLLDPELFLRSEQLIQTWTQKYLDDEVDVWEFEEGVWRAMTGASNAATIAGAEAIRDERPVEDEWVRLAREAHLKRVMAQWAK